MTITDFRPVLVVLASVFLMMAGAGTLNTVVAVRLDALGGSPLIPGAVMAAYFAGLTAGSLRAHRLVMRIGHIRAFSALIAILSAATLGHELVSEPAAWAALRGIEGYAMAGLFVCCESWLNQRATVNNRGKILALYMVCLYAGYGGGQGLLSIGDGRNLFAMVAILLSAALVPMALTRQTAPEVPKVASLSIQRLYAASPLGTVAALASGLITGTLYALGPIYALKLGAGPAQAGLFMSALVVGGLALQWPLGWLSDVFDRRRVLVAMLATLAVASLVMSLCRLASLPLLMGLGAGLGGIAFVIYPLSVAHTNDHLPPAEMIPASGGLILCYSAGATMGPLAASAMMDRLGGSGMLAFVALAAAATAAFGALRMRARPPVPGEDQIPYLGLAGTTPAQAPLDPRAVYPAPEPVHPS